MGYKDGKPIGKAGHGRVDPLDINHKADRLGLGMVEHRKEKEMETKRILAEREEMLRKKSMVRNCNNSSSSSSNSNFRDYMGAYVGGLFLMRHYDLLTPTTTPSIHPLGPAESRDDYDASTATPTTARGRRRRRKETEAAW